MKEKSILLVIVLVAILGSFAFAMTIFSNEDSDNPMKSNNSSLNNSSTNIQLNNASNTKSSVNVSTNKPERIEDNSNNGNTIKEWVRCSDCGGTGGKACSLCEGKGCQSCSSGKVICKTCRGSGGYFV